jgi:hypothetical protein
MYGDPFMPTLRAWVNTKGTTDQAFLGAIRSQRWNPKADEDVAVFQEALDQDWTPTPDDELAAVALLEELNNRIITRPLHFRSGDEKTALDSIHFFFAFTKKLSKDDHPNCPCFKVLVDILLNKTVRSFTAKWHKISEGGGFRNANTCCLFRRELLILQDRVRPIRQLVTYLADQPYVEVAPTVRDYIGGELVANSLHGVRNAEVLTKEREEIIRRRNKVFGRDNAGAANVVGLAISGGGIRSATFALGVVQCLAEKGMLPAVDYLSTVSGGGYLGSFLSSYLNSNLSEVGAGANQLPFKKVENNEAPPIRRLRNHSKYLIEGDLRRSIGHIIYGVLINLVIIYSLIGLLAIVTVLGMGGQIQTAMDGRWALPWPWLVLGILGGVVVLFLCVPIFHILGRRNIAGKKLRDRFETAGTWLVVLAAPVLLVAYLPALFGSFHWALEGAAGGMNSLSLSIVAPGTIAVLVQIARELSAYRRWLARVFWFLGPLACLVIYLVFTRGLVLQWYHPAALGSWWPQMVPLGPLGETPRWFLIVMGIDAALIVYCFTLVNINLTSPHRVYRDLLAKTYLLVPEGREPLVGEKPFQKLSELSAFENAPYHLINGALNLSKSENPELRGRASDFFLFSKHFCGSPILGYVDTQHWQDLDGDLDLGTAMAISGAAAAPVMGMSSIFGAGFQLALLNVRLAYWMRPPKHVPPSDGEKVWAWLKGPGPGYLLREMLGWTHESSPFVNVSDGGHLENLGVHEVLRRKCKFIIAIDGECDEAMVFPSLMRVISFAKIDFGIDIDINLDDLRLDGAGASRAHCALGTIKYTATETGYLLYIKSSLTGDEPDYVRAYKAKAPSFPHESTAKQLFAEDQFEAYRALGHHAASTLFQPELLVVPWALDAPICGLFNEWFKRLAYSMLPE